MSAPFESQPPAPLDRSVLRRVFAENFREHAWGYAFAVFCMGIMAGATAFGAWIIRDIFDKVFIGRDMGFAVLISAAIAAAFILRGIATYAQAVTLAKIGNAIVASYQRRVFRHLMRLGLGFFTETRSGQLAARVQENVNGVRDLLNVTVTSIARDIVTLIGLVAVMIVQEPLLSLSTLLIGPPLVLSVNYLMRRVRSVARQSVEANSRLVGALQETAQGIAIVKAFTLEDELARRVDGLASESEARFNKISRVAERSTPIAETLAAILLAGVVLIGGWRGASGGANPGSLFSFITALLLAYDPARRLARVQVGLERAFVNARMIYEILDIEPRQRDRAGARLLVADRGEIRFDDVTFSYAPGTPVLSQVSFVAEAGRTTAIVGASGAGKSTLISLIERFHDLDAGRILVDGQDIAEVTKKSLRGAIAYVSQAPWLFEGTIRDNIRFGRLDADDAAVVEAARLAHCDEFIALLPQGLDTELGENGANLSGGQRQRISIARALVRNAPILLLDEATSALDNESEHKVQEALATVMAGRTTLVVAHRLSTIVHADKIIVMDGGRVAEQGTHDALLRKRRGLYAHFYGLHAGKSGDDPAAQAGGTEPARVS